MSLRADPPLLVRTVEPFGFARASRTFVELFGYSSDDLVAGALRDWIHPEDRAGLCTVIDAQRGAALARHRTKAGGWVLCHWIVRIEDGEMYALGRPHSVESEDGAGELAVGGASTDKLLDSMALVVESKNPGMKCSILLTDRNGTCVSVGAGPSLDPAYNEAVEGLEIGPSVGSCGTAAYWNVPVIVEDIAEDPLWRNLRDAAAMAGVAACWSQPIRATDGRVLGAMALYATEPSAPKQYQMDGLEIAARMVGLAIERRALEAKIGEAAKLDALGVLAGGVAHDFNNLLAAVLGNAELAIETLPKGRSEHELLQAIVAASDSAMALCNQMLAYTGRGSRCTETVDCNAVIEDVYELLRTTLSKKASLVLDLDGELGVVADQSQLRQVLMNLITNASDAIGENEGRVSVSTRGATLSQGELAALDFETPLAAGDLVLIEVADDGCGMSPEAQTRIFDPFYTTKPAGRGLGMAAVRGIIQAHDGALRLESRPGEGTTFTIYLPRVPLETAATELAASERDASAPHVLVVDDEPAVLEIVSKMLAHDGMKAVGARNGQEAIDIFRREKESIDCVLLDLNMPKLDGEEVFRELKAIREDVRVVLSSGYTEMEVLERFRGAGLAGAIQKPVRMKSLLATIRDAASGEA